MELKINLEEIQDYYYATDDGKIISYFNKEKPIYLKLDVDKDGYFRTSLQTKDNKRKNYRVSRLIALTFLKNPNNYPVVNHIDTIKKNNNVSNLEWTTISYNTKHAYDNNLIKHARIKRIKSINIETGEEIIFEKMKFASDYFSINVGDISRVCSKTAKREHIRGIKFEYLND